jgi:DUF4097 and DUF4098 domain-containing protein YvlB
VSDTYTFEIGERPRIEFRVQSGRIDCTGGTDSSISVDVAGRGAETVRVEQEGGAIVVSEDRSGWISGRSVRLHATIPVGTAVELAGGSIDLHLDVEVGELVVKTASGDVGFLTAHSLDVKTASGHVRGDRIIEDARIRSASGDAYIDSVDGSLSASLVSGDVRVGTVTGDLRVNSASGDVDVEHFLGSEVGLKSVSGELSIGLPTGIRLDANVTTLSGEVHLPGHRAEGSAGERRKVRLDAKTVSGDIRILVN